VAMNRARVPVEEPHATLMTCEDARDRLALRVDGRIGLTEWALLEAHLRQCAECRQADACLRQVAAAGRPVRPPRAVLASLVKAMERVRIEMTRSTARAVRRRALLATATRAITLRAAAGVMRGTGLAVSHLADLMARIRASAASARTRAARATASALQALAAGRRASLAILLRSSVAAASWLAATRRGVTHSVQQAIRFRPSVQAVGVVLALAVTLYALQRAEGPQQLARPPAASPPGPASTRPEPAQVESARLEPSQLEPAQPESVQSAPPRPEPSVETKSAPPQPDKRRGSPDETLPQATAFAPPDRALSEPARGVESPLPRVLSELPLSAVHVVGRLSARNPSAARHGFIALLAEVGGTELARSHRARVTAVEVVVPESRYNEFADGLARIGSWRLEAARFPLPDAVHISIRISE
jgi:predicted anti-sigma-YlaC factor YlaD